MLRLVVGLTLGLAIGLGVGWVVFADPFASDELSREDVERAVAREAGTANADCGQRQNPANVWDCTTDANENTVLPLPCLRFVATVRGEQVQVQKQRRDPFNEC